MHFSIGIAPFILSSGGVLLDYLTTTIGLNLGFQESCQGYHPLKALFVFWGIIAGLSLVLPREKKWEISINAVSLLSYVGAVNNLLVLSGFVSV